MNEENNVDNELLQNETETGESVAEVVAVDYTELLEQLLAEEQAQTEVLVEERGVQENVYLQLQTLNGTLLCVFVVIVLDFCWACMRQWRKNILKMGE